MAFAGTGTASPGGYNVNHTLTFESSFGSGINVNADVWLGTITGFTCRRIDRNHYRKGLNGYSTWDDNTLLNRRYEGTITGEVNNGVPYALALGAIKGTTDPDLTTFRGYGHISGEGDFAAGATNEFMPSFAFSTQDEDDVNYGVKGATCTNGTFTTTKDSPTTFALDYVAQAVDPTDILTGATAETTVYGYHNTSLEYDDTNATTGVFGTSDGTITNWTESVLTLTPTLEIEPNIDATTYRQPRFKAYSHAWSLTRYASDDDFWSTTDFPATKDIAFRLDQDAGALQVPLDFQHVKLNDIEHGVDQDDLAVQRANFNMRYVFCDVEDGQTYVEHV